MSPGVRRLFGTDGVRGTANTVLTPPLAMALGAVAVQTLGKGRPVVVGRDPRRSGDLLECALVAGILSQGADAIRVGVLPTPGVSHAGRSYGASASIVVSASHNPVADNGIKFFGPDGRKLDDALEARMEAAIAEWESVPRPSGITVGKAHDAPTAGHAYAAFLAGTIGPRRLDGMRIVLDCAHGAASNIAPDLFRNLGAEVVAIGSSPDGCNINDGFGSTAPGQLARTVRETGADVGLAFDGDADRVILCDAKGEIFDGDRILCCAGLHAKANGTLVEDTVVGTVMSNLGLEHRFSMAGIRFERADVGDRYVMERMEATGARLGGEQSGHVLFTDISPTGDGILTGLRILRIVRETERSLEEWAAEMTTYPQLLLNVEVSDKSGWEQSEPIRSAIASAKHRLGESGRVNVRPSGTEPKIRVMVEAPDRGLVTEIARSIADVIRMERGTH